MTRQGTRREGRRAGRGLARRALGEARRPEREDTGASRLPRQQGLYASAALPLGSLLLFAGLIYGVWEAVSRVGLVPNYVLPVPLQVAQELGDELASGALLANAAVTLQEALGGVLLAAVVAGISGYAIAHVRPLELVAAPFIAASQAVPVVAVAPLIILLFGGGLWPKAIICAVVVVFPLLITVVTGLRGVERDYHDVARVFGASRLQTLWYLELPLAAPVLFSGLKIGLTLSLTGALVGEFLAADAGLGFMINTANSGSDAAKSFVGLITTVLLSVFLFGLVTIAERTTVRWLDVQP